MLLPFLNFVFVNAVVATPVIHVDHRVSAHGWGVTSASANDLVAFWLYWCAAKLWNKPDAS
jgi:hypothetical protein